MRKDSYGEPILVATAWGEGDEEWNSSAETSHPTWNHFDIRSWTSGTTVFFSTSHTGLSNNDERMLEKAYRHGETRILESYRQWRPYWRIPPVTHATSEQWLGYLLTRAQHLRQTSEIIHSLFWSNHTALNTSTPIERRTLWPHIPFDVFVGRLVAVATIPDLKTPDDTSYCTAQTSSKSSTYRLNTRLLQRMASTYQQDQENQ